MIVWPFWTAPGQSDGDPGEAAAARASRREHRPSPGYDEPVLSSSLVVLTTMSASAPGAASRATTHNSAQHPAARDTRTAHLRPTPSHTRCSEPALAPIGGHIARSQSAGTTPTYAAAV